MALATITETLELPGGVSAATARRIIVRLRLVVDADTEGIGRADDSPASIGGVRTTNPNGAGTYTFTGVRPNSGSSDDVITSPTGTVYELVIVYPGRPAVTRYLDVPDSAGPHEVADLLTIAPDPLPTGQDLLDLIDAAGLDLTDLPNGVTADAVIGLDGGALVELTPAQVMATHTGDTVDAHDASAISYAGGTGMSATDVEAAIDELATEKANLAGAAFTGAVSVTGADLTVTGAGGGSLRLDTNPSDDAATLAIYGSGDTQPRIAVGFSVFDVPAINMGNGTDPADVTLYRSADGVVHANGGGFAGIGKGLVLTEQSAPSSPAANDIVLYAADDGGGTTVLRTKDYAGTVTTLGSGAGLTAEDVRDTIGTALVEGEAIDITVNDGADTISIAAEDASDTNKGVVELATAAEARTAASSTVVLTAAGGAGVEIGWSTPLIVGSYYPTNSGAAINITLTLNQVVYVPVSFRRAATLDRLGIAGVTGTIASSTCRMGIYSDAAGVPGSLVIDAGTAATSGTGAKEITISQAVDRGRYWLAICAQGGASGPNVRGSWGYIIGAMIGSTNLADFNTATSPTTGYAETGVSGALPATATPVPIFAVCPILIVRASA